MFKQCFYVLPKKIIWHVRMIHKQNELLQNNNFGLVIYYMKYTGRMIGLILALLNITLLSIYLNFQNIQEISVIMISVFPLLCLPFFWWLGKLFDISKKQAKELKTSKEKFQTIFEKAAIGISLIDETGRPVDCNPKLEEILGYSKEELRQMTFNDFSEAEGSKKNMELLTQLVNREIDSYQLEKKYFRKDGKTVWGHITTSLFPNSDGELFYCIGMLVDITERKEAEQKLLEANRKLEYLSNSDGLTGIANRRYFDEYLSKAWNYYIQRAESFSLIILDIDFFKQYNDTYGHHEGDNCLKKVAQILKVLTEDANFLCARIGGEEFSVILPGFNKDQTFLFAEKIRLAVENMHLPHSQSQVSEFVTISVGLASTIPDSSSIPGNLFKMADKALYKAKILGKNSSCYYSYDDQDDNKEGIIDRNT